MPALSSPWMALLWLSRAGARFTENKRVIVDGRHEGVTLQMAGQWLLLEVQGLGLRLAWDLKVFDLMH